MRAYLFGHGILSDKQHGIQGSHVISEMIAKYAPASGEPAGSEFATLLDWAMLHKTIILMNGRTTKHIIGLSKFLDSTSNPYPFASFTESKEFADGLLTSVGCLLPESIYIGAKSLRGTGTFWHHANKLTIVVNNIKQEIQYSDWEIELMRRLNTFRLL